jgi:hypothetical protein
MMSKFNYGTVNQDKIDANEFCMKDMAISNLMERDKCAEKADRFVNYVFERCRTDTAPFVGGKERKVKAMSELL